MKELIVKLSGIFGFDLFVYNEIIHREKDFVFRRKNPYYLAVRFFAYVVILMMAIAFLTLFGIIQDHKDVIVPVEEHGVLEFSTVAKEELSTNWIHLLFGLIYVIMVYKTIIWAINLSKAENGKLSDRKRKRKHIFYGNADNLLYSFDYAFMWYIIIICIARLALDFTIGHYQVIMNSDNHTATVAQNVAAFHNAYWFHAIYVLYYVLIITTCSLVVVYLYAYMVKPELKDKFIREIKDESILYIARKKAKDRFTNDFVDQPNDQTPSTHESEASQDTPDTKNE